MDLRIWIRIRIRTNQRVKGASQIRESKVADNTLIIPTQNQDHKKPAAALQNTNVGKELSICLVAVSLLHSSFLSKEAASAKRR
jgi:hypothetical protein